VRRDAVEAPSSSFHQVAEQPLAAPSGPAWWQAQERRCQERVAACRQPVAAAVRGMASPSGMKVVESSVRPAASAPQVRLPVEEAAVVWGAKAQPQEAAAVLPGPSARQPEAAEEAEVVSDAEARPREAASDVEEAPPQEAAGVVSDAAAEPQQVVAAAEPDAVAAQLPGVAAGGLSDGQVQRPEVGHPSAPPSWRPEDHPRRGLAPRRAERSAHAMRRSRAASPSRRSWRAAGCEDLS